MKLKAKGATLSRMRRDVRGVSKKAEAGGGAKRRCDARTAGRRVGGSQNHDMGTRTLARAIDGSRNRLLLSTV
jgi:hypothetical protein